MEELARKISSDECVAALDLGTNSSRLLIAACDGTPVYRDVRHVALGEGLAENKCFSDKAMERAICSYMDPQIIIIIFIFWQHHY